MKSSIEPLSSLKKEKRLKSNPSASTPKKATNTISKSSTPKPKKSQPSNIRQQNNNQYNYSFRLFLRNLADEWDDLSSSKMRIRKITTSTKGAITVFYSINGKNANKVFPSLKDSLKSIPRKGKKS